MRLIEYNGKDILPELPTDIMGYVVIPQALVFGYGHLRSRVIRTFCVIASMDYMETKIDQDGKVFKARKGYIEYSKSSLCKMLNMDRSELNKDLRDLEAEELIIQEQMFDSSGRNISTRIRFNYLPFIDEQDRVNTDLDEKGIKHRLGIDNYIKNKEEEKNADLCDQGTVNSNSGLEKNTPRKVKKEGTNKYKNNNDKSLKSKLKLSATPSNSEVEIDSENESKKELLELPTEFIKGVTQEENPPNNQKKAKEGWRKKVEAGDYGRINVTDLLEYFKYKYIAKYKMVYSIPTSQIAKTRKILGNSFLAKYGAERCLFIIDMMFDLYEAARLDTHDFPRPTVKSLTQDWMINKLYDEAKYQEEKKETDEQIAKEEKMKQDIIPGKYTPFSVEDITREQLVRLNILKLQGNFWMLARRGYIDKECLIQDDDRLVGHYVEEVDTWNKINTDRIVRI